MYDSAGNPDQERKGDQKGSYDSEMYMVPLKSHQEEKNQYEQPQVSALSLPKMKLPTYEGTTISENDHIELKEGIQREVKKPVWFITMCVFITVFAVITIVALSIGALSLNTAQHDRSSSVQFGTGSALSESEELIDILNELSSNYTHLLDEISALNNLLVQLHSDTQRNNSQLINQFANQHQVITSISHSLTSVVGIVRTVSTSVNGLANSAYRVSNSVSQLSTSVSTLSYTSVNTLSASANSLAASARSVSMSASQLSVSASKLSFSSAYSLSWSVRRLSSTSVYSLSWSVRRLSSLSVYSLSTSVRWLSSLSVYSLSTSVHQLRYTAIPSLSRSVAACTC